MKWILLVAGMLALWITCSAAEPQGNQPVLLSPQPNSHARTNRGSRIQPDQIPIAAISSLTRELALRSTNSRVRIQGVVLDQRLGESVVVEDDTGWIRADTRQLTPIPGGEEVTVWGRLTWDGNNVILKNGRIRPLVLESVAEQKVTPAPGKPAHLPTLTQVRQIRDLPPSQAAWEFPVHLRAVATTVVANQTLFVQDDTAGIYVKASKGQGTNCHVGDLLEIEGVSGPGGYAPIIAADTIRNLGPGKMPQARLITPYQMASGQFAAEFVEVRGVVHSARVTSRYTALDIGDLDGILEVEVPGGDALTNLVDSLVRVRGVCRTHYNSARQFTGAYIWTPETNLVVVEEQGSADPFSLPTQPIAALSQFNQWRALQHRVKIAGVVTFCEPGRPLFVQDRTGGVPVYPPNNPQYRPGDYIQVAGYVGPSDFGYAFRDAQCQRLGSGRVPQPRRVFSLGIIDPNLHGTWVQLDARLVSSTGRAGESVLGLQADGSYIEAIRADTSATALPPIGSLVRVQGVYSILGDEARQPRGLRLYIPSTASIELLDAPSWWTPRHTLGVLASMTGIVLAGALWVMLLRRRVNHQTRVIRERLARESALEERYREIFEAANDPIFTCDPEGRLTSLNPAGQRLLGYDAQESKGLPLDQILHSGGASLKQRLLQTQPGEATALTCECRLVSKAGKQIEVETSARLVLKDGKVQSIHAISRDIAARKRAEEALRESEAHYRQLVELSPNPVFVESQGRFVFINQAALRLFGASNPKDILGKSVIDLVHPDYRQTVAQRQALVHTANQSVPSLEEKYLRLDGSVVDVEVAAAPLLFEARPGAQVIVHDITERKRADAALAEASALLQTLLDHIPDRIYFKDRHSRFVHFSQSFKALFKETDSSVLRGKSDFDYFTNEHAQPAYEDEQQIIRTGEPIVGKLEREVHHDGRIGWALTSKMPWRDKDANIIGTFGISKDVTPLKQAEAELAYERELFHALLDNLPDSIYFKDRDCRLVRVSRSKAQKTLDYARSEFLKSESPEKPRQLPEHLVSVEAFSAYLIGKSDFETYDPEFAKQAFEEEQTIMRTGKPLIGKLERIGKADKWFLVTKMAWRDRDGKIIGTIGVSRDITELKQAEADLEAAHRRLVETSRLAGMAEVATDVLHNVGNVLNSANVSCSITLERVRNSKVSSLSKVSRLLNENRERLAEFLTRDTRGQQIPEFLSALAEHLVTEQSAIVKEQEQLVKHVDHIKQIVAMQQTYAKVAGVLEPVNPVQLVEDALHINAAALTRHEVQVRRDYQDVPQIITEKHKVLQILVNLIRNAKYALDDSKRTDKELTITVGTEGQDRIRIQVTDNGVGIPRENLTRIFSHGFTTRKNGHGFGLHSSALAMRDLGGVLRVESQGLNMGATFVLQLPMAAPNRSEEPLDSVPNRSTVPSPESSSNT
jgi:PAS domain S-box-containing protein